jgi:hypothetical protein
MKKILEGITAALGWFAVGTQFVVSFPHFQSEGLSLGLSLLRYFGFYTVLTNIAVALSLSFSEERTSQKTKGAILVNVVVVGLIYNLILRHLWHPQGMAFVADTILHQVVPVFYLIYWLKFTEKGELDWIDPVKWLIFPLGYLIYVLVSGPILNFYPYPFIDVNHLGYPKVFLNSFVLTVVFLILGLMVKVVDQQFAENFETN